MHSFTKKTIQKNFFSFLGQSANYFITKTILTPKELLINGKIENQSFIQQTYLALHHNIFDHEPTDAVIFLWIISIQEFILTLIFYQKSKKNNNWRFVVVFILVHYYLMTLSLASYDSYERLRMPIESTYWFLLLWSFQRIILRLKTLNEFIIK